MIVTIDPVPTLRLIVNSETQRASILQLAGGVPYTVDEIALPRLIRVLRSIQSAPTEEPT